MSKEVTITIANPATPVQGLFRKRSSRPVHIKSWKIMLEKNGFVRCHLQHCRYIAYCIDDMREHFKTCRGEIAGNLYAPHVVAKLHPKMHLITIRATIIRIRMYCQS